MISEQTTRPPSPFADPKNRHTGGKKKANKPTAILRALRRVSKQEPAEDKDNLERELRKIKDSSPSDFLTRLQRAEAEHKRAVVMSQAADRRAEWKQSSGTWASAPGTPAPEAVDESEERCLALLEELLKTKGWKP